MSARARSAAGADPARTPLTALAGVGPARARALARLGLASLRDLLLLAPRGLEERGERLLTPAAAASIGRLVSVVGRIAGPRLFRSGPRRSVLQARLEDEAGSIGVLFFNQPWLLERLRAAASDGEVLELYGRVVVTRRGPALASPRIEGGDRPLAEPGSLAPVYPLTAGLGQELLRALVRAALACGAAELVDPLQPEERAGLDLPSLAEAARDLHLPPSRAAFERARRRVAFERLLQLQARLARSRAEQAGGRARAFALDAAARARWSGALPFPPTAGQARAIEEIAADLGRTAPMRRLLQGDVGSGKTLVALFALAAVAERGGQAALLAPTEILAAQHALSLAPWLARFDLEPALLSGSLPAAARRAARDALGAGARRVVIGTHALLAEDVRFARLDLVVIDEQQRFGVAQKQALLDKGRDVHALLLTATPIPRTLALCLYGDLETSVLAEKPAGRGRIRTRVLGRDGARQARELVRERLARGERGYWICPRIADEGAAEGTEAGEGAAAESARRSLADAGLGVHGLELVHGRIPVAERGARLERFRRGASRLLVGTSMLEVGIDVPEATVLVVEGAERFGLAQLHQLRGRIGRGPGDSECLLLADGERERLELLERTEDGFAIAEEDLRRRGMGDLAGSRQAGENLEGLASPELDVELVLGARRLVRERPELARQLLGDGALRPVAVV